MARRPGVGRSALRRRTPGPCRVAGLGAPARAPAARLPTWPRPVAGPRPDLAAGRLPGRSADQPARRAGGRDRDRAAAVVVVAALARAAPPRPPTITEARATAIDARGSDQRRSPTPAAAVRAAPADCRSRRPAPGAVEALGRRRGRGPAAAGRDSGGWSFMAPWCAANLCLSCDSAATRPRPATATRHVHRKHTATSWTRSDATCHSGAHEEHCTRADPPRRHPAARAGRRRRGEHRRAAADGAALRGLGRRGRAHRHQGGRHRPSGSAPTPSCST